MVDRPSLLLRRRLVDHLWRERLLHDPRIAQAFLDVPREVFLPETVAHEGLAAVYRDDAIVTRRDPESQVALSSSSQPAIMAIMLEQLDVRAGHRVLEVGAGTGYNAALLDRLAGPRGFVVSIDIDQEVVRRAAASLRAIGSRVHLVVGDGALGVPGVSSTGRPVDRIMVTASTAVVPRSWYDQLADDGRLVVPLRLSEDIERAHAVTGFRKVAGGFDSVAVTPGGFMPLRRHDGSIFDPIGQAAMGADQPVGPADGGGGSPFSQLGRADMDRLALTVRYGVDPPAGDWRFDRGSHWITVDVRER